MPDVQAGQMSAEAPAIGGAALPRLLAATVGAAVVATAGATAILCGGGFSYSLDDPYIALSLAARVAEGHYGINAGEYSAPASSILYPLLLAPFARTPFFAYVPAVLNGLAASATAFLLGWTALRFGIVDRRRGTLPAALLLVLICLAINLVGLVFTGLEHSLHLLTSLLVVLGLVRTAEERKVPAWLPAAIVLLPLWRFEGAALSLLAIAALVFLGRWRTGIASLAVLLLLLGGFALALHGMGLPPLPASLMLRSTTVKAAMGFEASPLQALYANLVDAIHLEQARPLLLLIAAVVIHPLWRRLSANHAARCRFTWSTEIMLAVLGLGTGLAHVLFGAFSGFYRYEVYAVAVCAYCALLLWQGDLFAWLPDAPLWQIVLAGLIVSYVGMVYLLTTLYTPAAARGIYEQQYQMRRFVLDFYPHPVAINDLGWVSFGNPNYVLDIIGLGSEPVRQARMSHAPTGWLDRLLVQHDIGLVMAFPEVAGPNATAWRQLAILHTSDPVYSSNNRDVTFYAATPAAIPDLEAALARFAAAVKPWAELRLTPID